MAYPTSTAGALYGNLSRLAQSVMPMFDPQVQAQAEQFRRERELFPLKKRSLESDIGLTDARTATEGFQQKYLGEQTGFVGDKRLYQQGMNKAQGMLMPGGSMPTTPASAGNVPFTTYSTGADAGGPDEMQDTWTNKGFSATGPNLVPGMVAVNPSKYGIGTVFRDPETGEAFIAGDKHGNNNPDVVDFYQDPANYTARSGKRNLEVVGHEKLPYGTTGEQITAILSKYGIGAPAAPVSTQAGDVLPDMEVSAAAPQLSPQDQARLATIAGYNPEQYVGGQSRAEALAGGFSEGRGRELALAQGILPSQTTAITPGYQTDRDRALAGDDYRQATDVARVNQAGDMAIAEGNNTNDLAVADMKNRYGLMGDIVLNQMGGGRRGSSAGSGGSMPLMPGAPRTFGDMQKLEEEAAAASFQTFGVPMEDGAPGNDPFTPQRRAWQQSYIELRKQGLTRADAAARANIHHFNTPSPAISSKDGWFSDPSIPQMQPEPIAAPNITESGHAAKFDLPTIMGQAARLVGLGEPQEQVSAPVQQGPLLGPDLPTPATKPAPQGKALGSQKEESKNAEKSAEGSRYNEGTLSKLAEAAKRAGVSIEDIAATAFAGGKSNDKELSRITRVVNDGPALANGLATSIRPEDIRNAFLDANAMQRVGIDPAVIRQYIPGADQTATAPNIDALLEKYR